MIYNTYIAKVVKDPRTEVIDLLKEDLEQDRHNEMIEALNTVAEQIHDLRQAHEDLVVLISGLINKELIKKL